MSETLPTARLEARFQVVRGRAQMSACFAQSPLKIAKTFAAGEGLDVLVMDCSPGMLAGDHYELAWHLDENVRVGISTQGFTRVHPSRERPCLLRQRIRLERGAWLEYHPEPTMLFRDASLRSECEVEIAPDATLMLSEIVCAGRIGHGEAFGFDAWHSRTRVKRAGKLIFVNQTGLRPAHFDMRRAASWGGWTHSGSLLVFSEGADEGLLLLLRTVLDEWETRTAAGQVYGGASLLEYGGVAFSLLGKRACDLQGLMRQLREKARVYLRGATSSK